MGLGLLEDIWTAFSWLPTSIFFSFFFFFASFHFCCRKDTSRFDAPSRTVGAVGVLETSLDALFSPVPYPSPRNTRRAFSPSI